MDAHLFHTQKSLRGKQWQMRTKAFSSHTPLAQQLFEGRALCSTPYAQFVQPSFKETMPNPSCIPNMDEAVHKALPALLNKQPLGILADYDVDGGTSASLLYHYISALSPPPFIVIPDRLNEGYGPKKSHIDTFLKKNIQTLFIADCGTAAHDVVAYAWQHGMTVIILDHHTPENTQSVPEICVNPMLDSHNSLHYLCAAGVTFMFLVALQRALRPHRTDLPDLHTFLDLVAVGTICDMVPLLGLNRTFVQRGLTKLRHSHFLGLRELVISTNTSSASDVGFRLGPSINAGSRMGYSQTAAKLLTTNTYGEAQSLCQKLINLNNARKAELTDALAYATELALTQQNDAFIVLHESSWSPGIAGLIAARIADHYHKPTFVITSTTPPLKGAARSPIETLNLAHIIQQATREQILVTGGGHQSAAGFSIEQSCIPTFKAFLEKNHPYPQKPALIILDGPLPPSSLASIAHSLDALRPFGMGNPEPMFLAHNVRDIHIIKQGEKYISFSGMFENMRLRFLIFSNPDCPIRSYLSQSKQAHFAGHIDTQNASLAAFIVRDAYPAE